MKTYTNSYLILGVITVSLFSLTSASAQVVVDGGFEAVPAGSMALDASPDVVNNLDGGWLRAFEPVDIIATGGNPGQWADMSRPNPTAAFTFMGNVFTNPGGFTVDQVLQFEYDLSSLGGTPNFADNSLIVDLYGTNTSVGAFATSLQTGLVGPAWSAPLATITPTITATTSGFVTASSSPISFVTLNSFNFLGLRVRAQNIADGPGQPGQEQLKLDNFAIIAVPEPSTYGLICVGVVISLMLRRRLRKS